MTDSPQVAQDIVASMVAYVTRDPDQIPPNGMVNLNRIRSDLEALGFEVPPIGRTGHPEVYIEFTTTHGTVSLSAPGEVPVVHIRSLMLTMGDWVVDLADLGCTTYRQIAAVICLLAATGEVPVPLPPHMGLHEGSTIWTPPGWSWDGWDSEEEESDNGRPGVDFLTIRNPDGEEVAVIVDRRNVSPANRDERRARKQQLATAICDAMSEKPWPLP